MLDIDENRVEPLDGGERIGLSRRDQRAGGDQRPADPTTDRGRNPRVMQIDRCRLQRRALLRHGRMRLVRRGAGIGIILLAHRLDLGERPIAFGLGLRRAFAGDGIGQVRPCLINRSPIERGIDLVQGLAGPDDRSFCEQAGTYHPRHLRANLGHLIGRRASGELRYERDRLASDDNITCFGRWRRVLLLLSACAGSKRQHRRGCEYQAKSDALFARSHHKSARCRQIECQSAFAACA